VITVDTVALVDIYPAADERVLAEAIVRNSGGPATVAAIALSRLGIKSAIVGTVGDDEDGWLALDTLKREGVEVFGVNLSESPTSGSVIVASKSQSTRAISTRQPISQMAPNDHAKKLVASADWIHVDHVGINNLAALGVTRGQGPKISFDAGYGAKNFDVKLVDLFAPNVRQMSERYPELDVAAAVQRDSEIGENIVVATMGSKGSIGYSRSTGLVNAAPIRTEIVSTLGAGDVFHGALLAQLIEGHDLKSAMERANVVAALSCRGLDGHSAIPTKPEMEAFLSESKRG
jgi:sulfofructose kinase